MDLFSAQASRRAPLADRMRPRTLDEFIGQEHIVGKGRLLRRAIETDTLTSSIFFGPPGCGKTTLASVIAAHTGAKIAKLNAVTAGVKDVRAVIEQAEKDLKLYGTPTYLLLDECHRWSKTQSDSILPALESGIVRFIGSTTENPMVSMTGAVVSRCRLFQFYPLTIQDVEKAMRAALADKERGLGTLNIKIDDDAFEHIAATANGDARSALNALELAALTTAPDSFGIPRTTAIRPSTVTSAPMRTSSSTSLKRLSKIVSLTIEVPSAVHNIAKNMDCASVGKPGYGMVVISDTAASRFGALSFTQS